MVSGGLTSPTPPGFESRHLHHPKTAIKEFAYETSRVISAETDKPGDSPMKEPNRDSQYERE